MTRFNMALVALALGGSIGCGAAGVEVLREPVTVVPTRTAGVTFVIVRPAQKMQASSVQQPGDGGAVMPASDYILICDARGMTGMQCAIPSEAAIARYSYIPTSAPGPTNVDEGVGTLADVTITRDNADADADPTDARRPAAAPPPPPPPPPPPANAAPEAPAIMAPTPPPSAQAVPQ